MKTIFLSVIIFLSISTFGTNSSDYPLNSITEKSMLDFWIGEWDVKWKEGEAWGMGTNTIKKNLDGYAVTEDFRITHGESKGFRGMSLSVFNKMNQTWTQTWSDNQGGEFLFEGEKRENTVIFSTEKKDSLGNITYFRMRFYDILKNSFKWDWESSNNGKKWQLKWQILYQRKLNGNALTNQSILKEAPEEIEQFGRLVGDWDCTIYAVNQDSTWTKSKATWKFDYALNGFAVEDVWLEKEKDSTENTRLLQRDFHGKNIRIFNPDLNYWQCLWINNRDKKMSDIWKARKIDNELVMTDDSNDWRIVFYKITDNSFLWRYDRRIEENWKTISKISAKRIH